MTEPASPPPHLRLELLSQHRYVCATREMIRSLAAQLGFDGATCAHIALAVDEALTNVIRHGYQRRSDGRIWVTVWPLNTGDSDTTVGMRIVIDDEAPQVDPTRIKGRDLNEIRPGGLGVHIIRELMDRAEYSKRDGVGMRLTLEKIGAPTSPNAQAPTPPTNRS